MRKCEILDVDERMVLDKAFFTHTEQAITFLNTFPHVNAFFPSHAKRLEKKAGSEFNWGLPADKSIATDYGQTFFQPQKLDVIFSLSLSGFKVKKNILSLFSANRVILHKYSTHRRLQFVLCRQSFKESLSLEMKWSWFSSWCDDQIIFEEALGNARRLHD